MKNGTGCSLFSAQESPMSKVPQDPIDGDLADFAKRGQTQRRNFHGHQPKRMSDIVAQLVQKRGYAQVRTAQAHHEAWQTAAGSQFGPVTEAGKITRGTLEVTAANSLVMQELTFEKERLLAAIQQALPAAGIKQLRFKVGRIG
jgi:predicted nucleic acid-binding Zn ribbon protein